MRRSRWAVVTAGFSWHKGGSTRKAAAARSVRLLLVLLVLGTVAGALPVAGQETVDYAGIVIRSGDGTVTYGYVPLDAPVSGIELLRRSGISLVTVGFGGLGEGVCQIEQTGCEVGACRKRLCQTGDRDSPYWRYFQQDDGGQWVAAPLGGSATKIAPGAVDGWSWSPDAPMLPEVDIAAIPELAQVDGEAGIAHLARYDANGTLLESGATSALQASRNYLVVLLVLAGVAAFGLTLRFRPRGRA